jgi:hypothetical protein
MNQRMKKKLVRNILWIALIAVWSFLAGAYFNLGWVPKKHFMSFSERFFLGGVGIWIVFSAMGILIYRFLKKNGNEDPEKPALGVVSFFTICFLLIAWVKYDAVEKDKFMSELEPVFIDYYINKAHAKGIEIEDLDREVEERFLKIQFDLRRDPRLDKVMELRTIDAIFEENTLIPEICIRSIKLDRKFGYPPPKHLQELFE